MELLLWVSVGLYICHKFDWGRTQPTDPPNIIFICVAIVVAPIIVIVYVLIQVFDHNNGT